MQNFSEIDSYRAEKTFESFIRESFSSFNTLVAFDNGEPSSHVSQCVLLKSDAL